jgi:hypothetical protein
VRATIYDWTGVGSHVEYGDSGFGESSILVYAAPSLQQPLASEVGSEAPI